MSVRPITHKQTYDFENERSSVVAQHECIKVAIKAFSEGLLNLRYVQYGRIKTLVRQDEIAPLINGGFDLCYNQVIGRFFLTRGLDGGAPDVKKIEGDLDHWSATKTSLFISYQWKCKSIAESLQSVFKDFYVIRDDDHMLAGANLGDFMKLVKHPKLNHVLVIVSDDYLKSENCMREAYYLIERYDWKEALLPYVVVDDPSLKADIYSGYQKYERFWEEKVLNASDSAKEVMEICLKACKALINHLRLHISPSEATLKSNGYQYFFDTIGESKRKKSRFQEIEAGLSEAIAYEKAHDLGKAEECFKTVVSKLPTIYASDGMDELCAKVRRAYALFLKGLHRDMEAVEQLTIAISFGSAPKELFPLLKNVEFSRLSEAAQKVIIEQIGDPFNAQSISIQQFAIQILTQEAISIPPDAIIDQESAKVIAKAIRATAVLTTCGLSHPNIHGEILNTIINEGLLFNQSVRHLDLSANNISSQDAAVLANLVEANTAISHLLLGKQTDLPGPKNKMDSKGVESIVLAFARNTNLTEVDFGDNHVDLLGISKVIKALESNQTIQRVKFSKLLVTDSVDEAERVPVLNALFSNLRIIQY